MLKPLADRIRPESLSDVVGQKHILGQDKTLYKLISSGNFPNMIFYGPSGTGKTTVANIAAQMSDKKFYKLNATTASVSDIKEIASQVGTIGAAGGILLYLDEIQNFNKKQQQSLLEFIENGSITLIASTTENPYFYVYNAILSRSTVFEFKPISTGDVKSAILRGIKILTEELGINITIEPDALSHLASVSSGDVRKALNALEVCTISAPETSEDTINITLSLAEECTQKKAFRHDRDGDSHYDVLSALQKSIRGSDPDAAVHYLARLLSGGDMLSACRRLLVIAAEDVGLAYPQAITITKACVDSALQLGMPEARIPLSEATLLLATAPKSNSAICAIDAAMSDIESGNSGDIPLHLKDAHYKGASALGRGIEYKYPHNYPNNYIKQQYLPDSLKSRKYYNSGSNKNEQTIKSYWDNVKGGEK